jgi:hypothetical protein
MAVKQCFTCGIPQARDIDRVEIPNRYEAAFLLELIKISLGLDKPEREAINATICPHNLRKFRGR